MAKSNAAKKTEKSEVLTWWEKAGGEDVHEVCGHEAHAHVQPGGAIECPALPPSHKQVTVDEAVIAKGGKPGFVKELEDATGVTAAKEQAEKAAEHFAADLGEHAFELIEVKHIRPSPRNPRSSLGDLTELANSLSTLKKMLQPIIVREVDEGRGYEIVSGHRRFAAAVDLGWDEVPCVVYDLTEVQALEVNLSEQINRRDLTPLEEGEACRALIELSGYDKKQVAAKLGQSESWVTKRLSLCQLAPELKKKLAKAEINVTLANALAALPTQKMQVEAVEKLQDEQERYGYDGAQTSDEQLEYLRKEFCRPLKGAPWKLTDADLVPEAGACSACPKNSGNNQAPGLFDNVKAPPTCSNLPCFESKLAAVWAKATAKYKAEGAKILPHGESTTKLFNTWGDEVKLNYGSRYVEAKAVVQEDGSKRSWAQLIEKLKPEERPQLHIAQDPKGGIHELYVQDKATEAIAEHLELKWAKKATARAEESDSKTGEDAAYAKARKIREKVIADAKVTIAKRIANAGLTLPATRAFVGQNFYRLDEYLKAIGVDQDEGKWLKAATMNELLAAAFWDQADFYSGEKFEPEFLELAKAYGLDPKAMSKAYVDGEKSEAELDAKKKTKGGKS